MTPFKSTLRGRPKIDHKYLRVRLELVIFLRMFMIGLPGRVPAGQQLVVQACHRRKVGFHVE
jgi:hypothetical protein